MIFSRRLSRIGLLVATLTIMGSAISIDASTINTSWKGGTGNWSVSTDWTNGVPNNRGGNVYNATIDSGGTDLVSLDINATIASIALGGTSGSSTLQNLSGKAESLEVTGATTINNTGGLTFGNTSTLKFDGGLTAGGQVNLTGATATITGSLTLKSGSAATVSGGSTLTVNGNLTNSSTSFETANGTGNKVTVSGGFSNTGSLFLFGTADTLTVSKTLTNNAGATLALETSSDVANIGMLINSGSVTVGTGTTLNLTNQATGVTDVSAGSMLTVDGTLKAGSVNGLAKLGSVEGTLNLGNGQTTGDTPSSGTLTVAAGGSLVLNNSGTTLSVTGALSDSGSVTLNSGATLNLTQGMSKLGGALFLQNGKTTSITPSGGTLTLAAGSILEVQEASGLTVNGNLTNSSTSFETANGTGNKVTVSGGFSNSGSLLLFGTADTLTVSKTLTNNAGATLALESSGQVANISTLSNSGVFNINGGTANIGAVSNSGTVSISAGTVLNVTGAGSKYTQTAGTTTDDGSFTLPSGGALSLNSGSLFGRGTITGAVTSSGTITPGDSSATTGILTEKGAYTQNFAGVLDMSIGGTTVGAQFDQFTITGKASLNGALNVAEINGFTPTSGETFDIVNFASKAGAFSSCNGHSGGTTCTINSTEHFLVEYNPTNVTLKVVPGASSVTLAGTPEPSTLLMLGSGGLLLLAHLRGRERQSKDQGQSL